MSRKEQPERSGAARRGLVRRGPGAVARAAMAISLAFLGMAACSAEPNSAESRTTSAAGPSRDGGGNEGGSPEWSSHSPSPAVVSLAPLPSRFLLALGAGGQIVGVDAESHRLEALSHVPVVDLATAVGSEPGLVLVSELPPPDDGARRALESLGARLVAFDPHDFEDVMALVRDVGSSVVGHVRAMRYETELTRPLAAIGGASFGRPRPRVLAVVGFDPLVVAGGHSFETDLIEIAGGHSVTHPGEATRRELEPGDWDALAPDLVIVMEPERRSAAERADALARLPEDVPVEFFRFPGATFWLNEPMRDAGRLFELIEPYSKAMPKSQGAATPPRP